MRPKIAILLVIAFLTALAAPVRASWSCPDGTACVEGSAGRYVCAGDQCSSRGSCCKIKRSCECKHGTLPGLEPRDSHAGFQAPAHCRFKLSVKPKLTAVTESAGTLLWLAFDCLPVPAAVELTAPAGAPIWLAEYSLGYRPPPGLPTGPPRAPPTA